jgi:AcrR family transcriptional regulator
MNITDNSSNLREQILSTAEILFAKKGFRRTSIRDITNKANCNLASVNYYFQGKENLYIEVFNRRMELLTRQRIRLLEQRLSIKQQVTWNY